MDAPQRRPESPEEVKGKASPDPKPAQSHAAPASAPSRAAATVDSHHDVPEPAKAPTKAPKTAEGRFSVQVAAFKNAANAERLVASLKTDGFPAYQIQTPLDGGSRFLYRVRVGAFEDRRAAEQMLVRLQGRKVKGLVVATP